MTLVTPSLDATNAESNFRMDTSSPKRDGAMFCFSSLNGYKVYVDPALVAYVEEQKDHSRIVFSGGAELLVQCTPFSAHEIIRAWKQGEQD